jgi:hypothetical protein
MASPSLSLDFGPCRRLLAFISHRRIAAPSNRQESATGAGACWAICPVALAGRERRRCSEVGRHPIPPGEFNWCRRLLVDHRRLSLPIWTPASEGSFSFSSIAVLGATGAGACSFITAGSPQTSGRRRRTGAGAWASPRQLEPAPSADERPASAELVPAPVEYSTDPTPGFFGINREWSRPKKIAASCWL